MRQGLGRLLGSGIGIQRSEFRKVGSAPRIFWRVLEFPCVGCRPAQRLNSRGDAAMSASRLTNVRLITILSASLLAGYAGDEAYNVWWDQDETSSAAPTAAKAIGPPAIKVALAEPSQIAK